MLLEQCTGDWGDQMGRKLACEGGTSGLLMTATKYD